MCNMMDGLVPVSSLLLIRLLPSRAESSACVTGVATISWRRRRWHRRVAAIACLWRSRRAVPRSCSPSRPIRCGGRFGLLLLPLPPSVCPLDDLAPFISLSFGCNIGRHRHRHRHSRPPYRTGPYRVKSKIKPFSTSLSRECKLHP
jgi:hypothetical protein